MDSQAIVNLPELDRSTLRIEPDGLLDFNAIPVRSLLDEVSSGNYLRVVIDLGNTTRALDSGLAMLLLFHQQSKQLSHYIYLVNSSLPIREKLLYVRQAHRFHFINCRDCPLDNETTDTNEEGMPYMDMCTNCEKVNLSIAH